MWGVWGISGVENSSEHSFYFLQQNTTGFTSMGELVKGAGRACSVEVEALFHSGSEEALPHDLFGGILG